MWLYSPVCVGPGRKPRRPVFSQRGSFTVGFFVSCLVDVSVFYFCFEDMFWFWSLLAFLYTSATNEDKLRLEKYVVFHLNYV